MWLLPPPPSLLWVGGGLVGLWLWGGAEAGAVPVQGGRVAGSLGVCDCGAVQAASVLLVLLLLRVVSEGGGSQQLKPCECPPPTHTVVHARV